MKKIKNVMLTITEKCNLNCIYCFENNKSFRSMDRETALDIIRNELNEDNEYEQVILDFMGGEPFEEFALIKDICEYTWSQNWKKKYIFSASTNGTLIHGEIQDWLSDNRDRFICGISLDGLPQVHNYNRSNSFDMIDLKFFIETWPNQVAKMTIYPNALPYLYESVVYLHDLGYRITSNLAYGPDWSGTENKVYYEDALKKLIEYYLENENIEPTTIVNMDIASVAYPNEKVRKWCGMGSQMVAFDIHGKKYPCHFFQDMSSSMYKYEELIKIDFTNIQDTLEKKCKECILRNCCPTCYGYNQSVSGDFGKKDDQMCDYKKISALATSTLKYRKMIKKYNNDLSNLDDYEKENIVAIKIIQQSYLIDDWNIKL